jgi:hypothetical protein
VTPHGVGIGWAIFTWEVCVTDSHFLHLSGLVSTAVDEKKAWRAGIRTSYDLSITEIRKLEAMRDSGFWIWLTSGSNDPNAMYPSIIEDIRREIMAKYNAWKARRNQLDTLLVVQTGQFADAVRDGDPYKADVLTVDIRKTANQYKTMWAYFELIRLKSLSLVTRIRWAASARNEEAKRAVLEDTGETLTAVYSDVGEFVAKQTGAAVMTFIRENPLIVLGAGLLIYWLFFTASGAKAISGGKKGAAWTYREGKEIGLAAAKAR